MSNLKNEKLKRKIFDYVSNLEDGEEVCKKTISKKFGLIDYEVPILLNSEWWKEEVKRDQREKNIAERLRKIRVRDAKAKEPGEKTLEDYKLIQEDFRKQVE